MTLFCEKYTCPNCTEKILNCKCELNHCPFCVAIFEFTQDWNIHIEERHPEKNEDSKN